ncbi:hypothetical protein D3C75_1263200 [compost metagenome]
MQFLKPAIANTYLMFCQRSGDALDHLVVKNIGTYVKGALWREDHHAVQHQSTAGNPLQDAVLLGAGQHFLACFDAGIGLAG